MDALKRHVINKKIPVPGYASDLEALSSEQLEVRVLHATVFQRNWCSSRPIPYHRIKIRNPWKGEYYGTPSYVTTRLWPSSVSHIVFLNGHDGKFLVTVSRYTHVALWECPLRGARAFMVAEHIISDGEIVSIVANEDPKNKAVVAIVWKRRSVPRHIGFIGFSCLAVTVGIMQEWLRGPASGCYCRNMVH